MSAVRRAGAITGVNLLRLFRDRVGLFFTFVLPLLLITLLGLAFGDPGLVMGVVPDDDSPLAEAVVDDLRTLDGVDVRTVADVEELRRLVRRESIEGGVVVPDGFGAALAGGGTAELVLVEDPSSGDTAAFRSRVSEVLARHTARVQAARAVMAEVPGTSFDEALAVAEDAEAVAAAGGVEARTAGSAGASSVTAGEYSTIGQLVLFVFLIGLTGSGDIVMTRQLGVSRRMLATPTRPSVVVAGEGGGRFGIATVQSLAIVGVTALVFRVAWGRPATVGLLLVLFALVASGAALLMGTVARSNEQATTVGPVLGIAMGMLGGCMWPLEIVPEQLRIVGHLFPHAWAVDGLVAAMGERASVADVALELAVLAGFAAVLVPLAAWRLRRTLTR